MADVVRVEILGRKHAVTLPSSLIQREELYLAWAEARDGEGPVYRNVRLACALVGACTRIGRESGVTYEGSGCDAAVYGGRVYDHLRAAGVVLDEKNTRGPTKDIPGLIDAAVTIANLLLQSLQVFAEASEKEVFSDPSGGGSTAS